MIIETKISILKPELNYTSDYTAKIFNYLINNQHLYNHIKIIGYDGCDNITIFADEKLLIDYIMNIENSTEFLILKQNYKRFLEKSDIWEAIMLTLTENIITKEFKNAMNVSRD